VILKLNFGTKRTCEQIYAHFMLPIVGLNRQNRPMLLFIHPKTGWIKTISNMIRLILNRNPSSQPQLEQILR
jgi:hypothetical protein